MKKLFIPLLMVLFLVTACSGAQQSTPLTTPTSAVPSFLLLTDRVILHSASYTLVAKNPTRVLEELQKAVEGAGGYVSSASSYASQGSSNYASLNAKVPPEALAALSEKIDKLADQVQSRNVSVQDVTTEIVQLQQRHADLTQARDEILLYLISQKDLNKVSTYGILHELLENEMKSVEGQLTSYEQQSRLASLDVTINQAANEALPVE